MREMWMYHQLVAELAERAGSEESPLLQLDVLITHDGGCASRSSRQPSTHLRSRTGNARVRSLHAHAPRAAGRWRCSRWLGTEPLPPLCILYYDRLVLASYCYKVLHSALAVGSSDPAFDALADLAS